MNLKLYENCAPYYYYHVVANYKFYEAIVVKSNQRVPWLNKLFDIIARLDPELGCVNNEKPMSGCFKSYEWNAIEFTDAKSIFERMENGYREKFCTLEQLTLDASTLLERFPDLSKLGEPEYENFHFDSNDRVPK